MASGNSDQGNTLLLISQTVQPKTALYYSMDSNINGKLQKRYVK
jgi:hypothetical protein